MKNDKLHQLWRGLFLFSALASFSSINLIAQDTASSGARNNIIVSVRSDNLDVFDQSANQWQAENEKLVSELLAILTNVHSSNLQQCAAAYYLGEMRLPEASDALAANIGLHLTHPVDHLTSLMRPPAVEALVKIGNPSIPAVIRNLAESDDANVRDLSLKVLYRIDSDKDIVQLRLQKALAAEKDPQKQVRLQSALKIFAETPFVN